MARGDAWEIASFSALAGALVGPWLVLPAHSGPDGSVERFAVHLFYVWRDGPGLLVDPLAWLGACIVLAGAALACLGWLCHRHWVPMWTPAGWYGASVPTLLVGMVVASSRHDVLIYRTPNINTGWHLGWGGWAALAALLLFSITALARRDMRRPTRVDQPRWRRQNKILAGALTAALLAFAVPFYQVDVSIDSERTYDLDPFASDRSGEPIEGTMYVQMWGRTMPVKAGDEIHPWFDTFYVAKSGNEALHVAGPVLLLATVGHGVAFAWRARGWHIAVAACHVVAMVALAIGMAGELATDEYLAHGPLWPSWGMPAGIAAAGLMVWSALLPPVARMDEPSDSVMPPLPSSDQVGVAGDAEGAESVTDRNP